MRIQDIVRLGLLLALGILFFVLSRQPSGSDSSAGSATADSGAAVAATQVDFKFLARTKLDPQSPSKVTYPDDMGALDNQRISIVGFMAPFEEIDNMKKFMLLPSYVGCYFCAPPSFTQVLLVEQQTKAEGKLPFINDPIQVTGTLRLYSKDSKHPAHKAEFVYALDDAKVSVYTGENAPTKASAQPRKPLSSNPQAQTPAPTTAQPHKAFQPQFLVASVSDVRKLPMLRSIKFSGVAPAELERIVKEQVASSQSAEAWKANERALIALGFADAPFDLQRAATGLELGRSPGIFDAKNDTIFYNQELQFSKPEARIEMVKLITEALLVQNVSFIPNPPLSLDDAALAVSALHRGDVERTAKVYDQTTRLNSTEITSVLKMPAGYPSVSPTIQRLFETPRLIGVPFVEQALPVGETEKVNAAYAKPPHSTAEVVHAEYFLKSKPWEPKPVAWPNDTFNNGKPLKSGTLGEAGLAIWKSRAAKSTPGASGWVGDRYAVWSGGAEGDPWVLETHWSDEAKATQFFTDAEAVAGGSANDEDPAETSFSGHLRSHPYRVYRDHARVIVIGADTAATADLLTKQFVKP